MYIYRESVAISASIDSNYILDKIYNFTRIYELRTQHCS